MSFVIPQSTQQSVDSHCWVVECGVPVTRWEGCAESSTVTGKLLGTSPGNPVKGLIHDLESARLSLLRTHAARRVPPRYQVVASPRGQRDRQARRTAEGG